MLSIRMSAPYNKEEACRRVCFRMILNTLKYFIVRSKKICLLSYLHKTKEMRFSFSDYSQQLSIGIDHYPK